MSLMEWVMISAQNDQMLFLIAYHGHVNLYKCQLWCLSLSWCTSTKFDARISLCFCVLLEVLVGVFIIFSLGFYNEILFTLNLVDNLLWGIVAWFFSVGLVSCRCLVDLPGVKTLLLTNQQHQLPKELVYRLRHLKIQMRKDSDFHSTHIPTQMCLTSQLP